MKKLQVFAFLSCSTLLLGGCESSPDTCIANYKNPEFHGCTTEYPWTCDGTTSCYASESACEASGACDD